MRHFLYLDTVIQKKILLECFLLTLAFLLAVFFLWDCSPARSGFWVDREIFNYLAWSVSRGLALYRDVFDHKTPILVWFLAIFPGKGPWADWLAMIFITAFALRANWYFLKDCDTLTLGVLSLCYLSISTSPQIIEGGGLTRQVTGLLLYVLLACNIKMGDQKNQQMCTIWCVGLLTALIVSTQPESVLPAIPLIFLSIINCLSCKDQFSRICLHFFGGVCTILIPVVILISVESAWGPFLHQAILFNLEIYIPKFPQFYVRVQNAGLALPIPNWQVTLILLCSLISLVNQRNPRRWIKREFILLCSITSGLCAVALSGRTSGHYYLQVAPALSFLLACGLCELRFLALWGNRKILGNILTIIATLYFLFIFVPTHRIICGIRLCGLDNTARIERLPESVDSLAQQLRGQPESIFVFQAIQYLWVHREFEVVSPSRFIYLFPFLQFSPVLPGVGSLDEVLKSVETRTPRLIIDCSANQPLPPVYQQHWQEFIEKQYKLLSKDDSCLFYRRST